MGALVIASGVVVIAVFGAGSGSDSDDDEFGLDDNGVAGTRHQLFAVIASFNAHAARRSFRAYVAGQAAFLAAAGLVAWTQPPSSMAAKVAWGSMGGVLQGNVYFLKTGSTMAVIDFGEACTLGTFWVYTVSFIVIASMGLALNALAMRHYKATFCVCSFVGWYNIAAAISAASFFGSDLSGRSLALYLAGLGLITSGVAVLLAASFDDALKSDAEGDPAGAEDDGEGEGRAKAGAGDLDPDAVAVLHAGEDGDDGGGEARLRLTGDRFAAVEKPCRGGPCAAPVERSALHGRRGVDDAYHALSGGPGSFNGPSGSSGHEGSGGRKRDGAAKGLAGGALDSTRGGGAPAVTRSARRLSGGRSGGSRDDHKSKDHESGDDGDQGGEGAATTNALLAGHAH